MYGLRTWEEVRRLYSQEHKSARQIARELGISRNTVRRLLDLPQPPRYRRKPRESLLDPYRDIIAHLLHKNPFMPARAILDQLRSLGYKGSISSLRNYLASARFKEPTYHQQGDYHAGVTGAGKAAKGGSGDFPQALQEALVGCADTECGMNLISPDFDILMVNRTNERLFQKPMTEFLGRKCYEEFEKRQEVCPHCPGVAALATGKPHMVETRGVRDDGTTYLVRLTAYPIFDPHGEPAGFLEVEEDITERKRTENAVDLLQSLSAVLASSGDLRAALRHTLNAAFLLDGVDFGCAYLFDPETGNYKTAVQRGISRDVLEALLSRETAKDFVGTEPPNPLSGSAADMHETPMLPKGFVLLSISCEGQILARFLVGSSVYTEFPPATRLALETLCKILEGALANLKAQQLRKRCQTEVRDFLMDLPLPIWCIGSGNKVTFWNKAAEQILGWKAQEVLHEPVSTIFSPSTSDVQDLRQLDQLSVPITKSVKCIRKNNSQIELDTFITPALKGLWGGEGVLVIARRVVDDGQSVESGA